MILDTVPIPIIVIITVLTDYYLSFLWYIVNCLPLVCRLLLPHSSQEDHCHTYNIIVMPDNLNTIIVTLCTRMKLPT